MPHPRILKVLGMTPAQWGELPPESVSPERKDLKAKALDLIKQEDASSPESLGIAARLAGLESRVAALESKPPVSTDPPIGG